MSDSEGEFAPSAPTAENTAYPSGGGLFDDSDSDDTNDLIESAKKSAEKKKPAKKRLQKKNKDDGKDSKKKKKSKGGGGGGGFDPNLSKKERMELLARRRKEGDGGGADTSEPEASAEKPRKEKKKRDKDDKGYDSGDSYNSSQFVRTKEDDDFIDADDEDPEALAELYAEQHFDDERPDGSDSEDEGHRGRKKKGSSAPKKRGPDALTEYDLQDTENPIMAVVRQMKRKKKEKKKLSELEEEAKEFIAKMDHAADLDEKAFQERRPAMQKLKMLTEVLDTLAKKDLTRPLLDYDLLSVVRRWIQPLPNGSLPNVTIRQQLLQSLSSMSGDQGISAGDLKRSSLGKTVMSLYTHKSETPAMKRQHKALIEQWSRPIFQKSGNMKDLQQVLPDRRDAGIVGIARAQQATSYPSKAAAAASRPKTDEEFSSVLTKGNVSKGGMNLGNNRVRVPYSKGFQFTVRPADRMPTDSQQKRRRGTGAGDNGRDGLHKRMTEKGRKFAKNQRSANISVEGRPVK